MLFVCVCSVLFLLFSCFALCPLCFVSFFVLCMLFLFFFLLECEKKKSSRMRIMREEITTYSLTRAVAGFEKRCYEAVEAAIDYAACLVRCKDPESLASRDNASVCER